MVGVVMFFVVMFLFGLLAVVTGTKLINTIVGSALFLMVFRYLTLYVNDFKYVITLSLLAGVGGAYMAKKAKNDALFIFGFIIGIMLAQLILPFFPASYPSYFKWAVLGVTALLGGFFVKDVTNVFLGIAVSFFGGYLLTTAGLMLVDQGMELTFFASDNVLDTMYSLAFHLKDVIVPSYSNYILYGSLGLAVIGAFLQRKKK